MLDTANIACCNTAELVAVVALVVMFSGYYITATLVTLRTHCHHNAVTTITSTS